MSLNCTKQPVTGLPTSLRRCHCLPGAFVPTSTRLALQKNRRAMSSKIRGDEFRNVSHNGPDLEKT